MNYNSNSSTKVRQLSFYGLFAAMIYVATSINIPGSSGDALFHLGNIVAFAVAIVFGKKAGAVSAAVGMTLFDLTGPYASWAPFTFIIRLAIGYVLGYMANIETNDRTKSRIYTGLGLVFSTIIMLVGYYVAGIILSGNLYTPASGLFTNLMQCVVGTVFGLPLSVSLKAAFKSRNISTQI